MQMSNEAKNAILNIFANVAWTVSNGQQYYDALADAFLGVASISAVYSGGAVTTSAELDDLKADLVVTATLKDSTTQTVPGTDYTLSGTLSVGTSTITVSYGGKTTTFNVTVTQRMSYVYTDGDLIKLSGGIAISDSYGYLTIYAKSTDVDRRRCFVIEEGEKPLMRTTNGTTYSTTNYYPIPVPSTATSLTVTITPSTQYVGVAGYVLSDEYTKTYDPGWSQGSRTTTFTAGTYDYITIACKYNSSGTSYPTEPTELTITFE